MKTVKINWWVASVTGAVIPAIVAKYYLSLAFPIASMMGWAVALTVFVVVLLPALGLVALGRQLVKMKMPLDAQVFELAKTQHGRLTVQFAAWKLGLSYEKAESLLMTLSQRSDGRVIILNDADGIVQYTFPEYWTFEERVRIPIPQNSRILREELEEQEMISSVKVKNL